MGKFDIDPRQLERHRQRLERRLRMMPCMSCAIANVLEPGKCTNPTCCNYFDQEDYPMGYAGEGPAMTSRAPETLDRYAGQRSGIEGAVNGRRSPLAAATEQAAGVAEALRELIGRGHQQLDRIAGPSPDPGGLAKNPGPANEVEKQPAQLRQLEKAIDATGQAIEPLRHLVNRLEAL